MTKARTSATLATAVLVTLLTAVLPVASSAASTPALARAAGRAKVSASAAHRVSVQISHSAARAAIRISLSPESLPGEQTWATGVSSYIFGTNDGIDFSSPNVETLPSVQSYLKRGGLTLMRTWAYDNFSDASILQRVTALHNAGMQCMMMLGTPSDLAWMKHIVSMLGSSCNIYEFGNEPDNSINGTNIAQMVTQWNASIPALRAINPEAVFGGPAVQYPTSADGTNGSYPSDIAYFLAKTAASGVRADFISYHHYPCFEYTSESQCITDTPGTLTAGYDAVIGWEKQYYGTAIPTGISEYNFDPGSSTLGAFAGDSSFMYKWTNTALRTFVRDGFAFANQFTSLNYSGYGALDMFSDSSPYGPKAQAWAIVNQVEENGGPTTMHVPNPLP
jgi:hypothetical protein